MENTGKITLNCSACFSNLITGNHGEPYCPKCKVSFTKEQAIAMNKRKIDDSIAPVLEKAKKQLKINLQKAFRGNKYIKIR